ncbi:unnamed protein product [Blepharisma stoltei]|uniref:Serine/threonine-protein phosphatase 4 regulatory subunit 3-like central domain-containing protein n=1 Tax=Blepharisma stoltei TaxID=1481888 RepID=A0AAU9K685_9CILI|nr:unnamed protein product [Blepharisma stoltei]
MNDKIWRVKLYELTKEGQWEDLGIGAAQITDNIFEIISEDDHHLLLDYPVGNEVYKRQGDTILTWTDSDHCTFAVSFQNPAGAQTMWESFLSIQGKDINAQILKSDNEALPYPNETNLQEIIEILSDISASNRSSNIQGIIKDGFVRKLSHEFQLSVQKNDKEVITQFFFVYKLLLQFANNSILQELLSDENFFSFIGAMDHDPDVKCTQYLHTLTNEVKFINPLNITDTDFLNKIHAAFRLGFLKESQSARGLEESAIIFLSSYQIYLFNEIINHYIESGSIRANLIMKLKAKDFNSFYFLYELSNIAKSANMTIRSNFYDIIASDDILDIIENNWSQNEWNEDQKVKYRSLVAEIFLGIIQISPFIMKKFLLNSCKKASGVPFLADFSQEIVNSSEISSIQIIGEFLRTLLDGDEDQGSDSLYEILYDTVLNEFMKKFSIDATQLESSKNSIFEILSVLIQCIQSHNCRIRYFLIFHQVIEKALNLLDFSDNSLKLAVLKFFRTVIEKNDKFIDRFIITHNSFSKIIQVFISNGEKENMIFSSILAIIESLKKANSTTLIEHIITKHLETIENKNLRSCFNCLIDLFTHQKNEEPRSSPKQNLNSSAELTSDEQYSSPSCGESDEENDTEFQPTKRKHEDSEESAQKRFKTEFSEEFMT